MTDRFLENMRLQKEQVWRNPDRKDIKPGQAVGELAFWQVRAAQSRLMRFAPYISKVFPETNDRKGVIESPLLCAEKLRESYPIEGMASGRLWIKEDHLLPVSGSVKARGGIYEVLKHGEELLTHAGLLKPTDNYAVIADQALREYLSGYTIQVGSTGNLGLSIGLMGTRMGFRVVVHMSRDAKEWKKELLKKVGAEVVEYEGDYSAAVKTGRENSAADPNSYFVDDESSPDLFMGYATAAMRLKVQLYNAGVSIDSEHPLFVYIPCGVGGAPAGIAFGLKELYGDLVHIFTAEPTAAPCMMYSLYSGQGSRVSIGELGLSGITVADGLAVGRSSELAYGCLSQIGAGTVSVSDERMRKWQRYIWDTEGTFLEPSACAGMAALELLQATGEAEKYAESLANKEIWRQGTHVVWSTGGSLVPEAERNAELGLL